MILVGEETYLDCWIFHSSHDIADNHDGSTSLQKYKVISASVCNMMVTTESTSIDVLWQGSTMSSSLDVWNTHHSNCNDDTNISCK